MGKNIVESILGAVVLLVAATFVFISAKSGQVESPTNGYGLKAKFHEVGNLAIGSDVRIGGIKIGTVTGQTLDSKTYLAIVELAIKEDIILPTDSTAAIVSEGLLGGKYITIEPGAEEEMLANGETIQFTQDALILENLIGKFAFGGVEEAEDLPDDLEMDDESSSLVPGLDLGL